MRRGRELDHRVERGFQWEQILLHLLQSLPSLVVTIPFMMEQYHGVAQTKTLMRNFYATEPLSRGAHTDMDLCWGTPLPRLHSLVMAYIRPAQLAGLPRNLI